MDFPVGEKYCVQFIEKYFRTCETSLLSVSPCLTIGEGHCTAEHVIYQDISVILSDPSKALSHLFVARV